MAFSTLQSDDTSLKRSGFRWRFGSLELGTLLIALPVVVPLVVVLASLFTPAGEGWIHVRDTLLTEYVGNSLLLMVFTGVIAALVGGAPAWLTTQYRFIGDRWLTIGLVLPLALPTYVAGYVYADLLEYAGPLQSALRDLTGWSYNDYWFPAIRTLPGAALVMGFVLYPYVYLILRANLQAQSAMIHQAARSLRVSGFRLLSRITLPLARPALAGGVALVLMETAAEFGVVEHFGVPTLTTGVFRTWLAMGEQTAALTLAGYLFLLVMLLVVLEQATRSGDRTNLPTPSEPPRRRQLTGWLSALASLICLLPVLIGFVIPAVTLLMHTLETGDPLVGRRFLDFMTNSMLVSVIAALLCVMAAVWLGYTARLRSGMVSSYGIRIATLGYAVPGLVLATGALLPLTRVDHWLADTFGFQSVVLTGSLVALVIVYVARFLTVAFNSVQGTLAQIHPSLDAAARSLGASPIRMLHRVHLPMMQSTLLYATLLVFIDVMKELPATLVMRPFNFETLATRVYRLASDERLAEASTAALVIVALSLIPALLLMREQRATSSVQESSSSESPVR